MDKPYGDMKEHTPSFFKNSSPGNHAFVETKRPTEETDEVVTGGPSASSNSILTEEENFREVNTAKEGWTKSLAFLPRFDSMKIERQLIKNPSIRSNLGTESRAFRNKRQGYILWREGYVRDVLVKPNIKTNQPVFIIKAKVQASMKNVRYSIYVHLDQDLGDICFATCNCKAGQAGCCKHVAALLYTVLDFSNMDLKEVPMDLACTQKGQKWNVPSLSQTRTNIDSKFTALSFEKAEEGKTRKRPLMTGTRENYCATPAFAQETTRNELKELAHNLRCAGRASLFCEALESNDFMPCNDFETSSSRAIAKRDHNLDMDLKDKSISFIDQLYKLVPNSSFDVPTDNSAILAKVGVTVEESKEICYNTMAQSNDSRWFLERSKRVTASHFGKIVKRRQRIYPKSIVNAIIHNKLCSTSSMPVALKWGIENEDAAIQKYNELHCNIEVHKCGLVVSPKWPWLGCSPDGIILENSIPVGCIEVKCPYSKRNMTLLDASTDDKSFFLGILKGKLSLKRNHIYFFQCQGILNILGLEWIDFIVYTLKDLHIERIQVDTSIWDKEVLPELTKFYADYILPKLS